MDAVVHLDTHVVVWLYAGQVARLSRPARKAIESGGLVISPMVSLEMQFLLETGRIIAEPARILDALADSLGLRMDEQPFAAVMKESLAQKWTRDPFDRIIVAQALRAGAVLVSKDRLIRRNYGKTCW